MLTRDFDYELPNDAIAERPAPRGESRLLVLDANGADRHSRVHDLPKFLRHGDLLIVNDTRVIPARLFVASEGSERPIELLLVERIGPCEWEALAKPGKRARVGAELSVDHNIEAEVIAVREEDGRRVVRFSEPIEPHLERLGHIPLPPYIHRADDSEDRERYQTIYAREPGAIAAPTAGLHFSETLFEEIAAVGVETATVTLHVGIGTFKPVTTELVHEHRMERERWFVPEATAVAIARTRARGGRIVAVGTTVVRTLESAALAGDGTVSAGNGSTELFITPGFEFRVVDALLTNFHLPQSTLLMLVSAFVGRERALAAYAEAIAAGYRFYSYGDAMFATRATRELSRARHASPLRPTLAT